MDSQLLSADSGKSGDRFLVSGIIEKLGYVQIDTISVVQRAHHHTIWTRFGGYSQEMLHRLQAHDRKVFEFWGHAASYLPMKDYRYYLPRMRSFNDPMSKWARDRFEKCGHLMDGILERIRIEGPLGSRDFKSDPGSGRGQWWNWKPAKTALELLFWRGDLMVTRRENFHRIYDLTERVLPEGVDTSMPDPDQLGRFLVRRALSAMGMASGNDVVKHIHAAERKTILDSLQCLVDEGEIIEVEVEGRKGLYVMEPSLKSSVKGPAGDRPVHILSPFDNLIINRERASWLFHFDYALECYLPAKKRKFGYFVLPVLWGTELVARLDAKADRKKGVLNVLSLYFEEGFSSYGEFVPAFAGKLTEFACFNGCRRVMVHRVTPAGVREPLIAELDRLEGKMP